MHLTVALPQIRRGNSYAYKIDKFGFDYYSDDGVGCVYNPQ